MTATTEPSRVTAGDTLAWLRSLPDYPASAGWVLTYTLINQAGKKSVSATASGDDHLISVPAATSASWPAGLYTWVAAVAKAGERYTVGTGAMTIDPDLTAVASFDTRSSAKKALDAVNLAMETYGAKAYLQGYEINGRSQRFHTPGEFMKFRSQLLAEVASENNAARLNAGLGTSNQIKVRFGPR